jgi:hypothetical protein
MAYCFAVKFIFAQNTEFQSYNVAEFTCKWRNLVSRVVSLYNWETDIRGRLIIVSKCSKMYFQYLRAYEYQVCIVIVVCNMCLVKRQLLSIFRYLHIMYDIFMP